MRENELRESATCFKCQKPIGHAGHPMFYRLTLETFGLDYNAIQRQTGLTMALGGHAALAQVMGPDEEMAKPLGEACKLTVCVPCMLEGDLTLLLFACESD